MTTNIGLSSFFIPKDCLIEQVYQARDENHWADCQYYKSFANGIVSSVIVGIICLILIIIFYSMGHSGYAIIAGLIGLFVIGFTLGFQPWYAGKKGHLEYSQLYNEWQGMLINDQSMTFQAFINQKQQQLQAESMAKLAEAQQLGSQASMVNAAMNTVGVFNQLLNKK